MRIGLAQLPRGAAHLVLHLLQAQRQLQLLAREDAQLDELLRAEVLGLPGDGLAAQFGRVLGQLGLVVQQLRRLAVEAAEAVPLAQPRQQVRQRDDHRVLMAARGRQGAGDGRVGARRGALPGKLDLRGLDHGGQLLADDRQVLPLQGVDGLQHRLHVAAHVGRIDLVVVQVGQQRQDVHGHALAAADQRLLHLALAQGRGLEAVHVELPPRASFPAHHGLGSNLPAALLLQS